MSSVYARLLEKNLFEGYSPAETGSEVVDLMGWEGCSSKYSCQAIYDVQTPSAKTFDSGEAEIVTFTFAAKASTTAGDYAVVYDTTGLAWAIAADITGTDPEPTGAVWTAIPSARKAQVDLSAATTDADVAAAFATAFNALTAVPFAAVDTLADVAITQDLRGPCTAPDTFNEDDSGAGSISVAVTNAGVASEVTVADSTLSVPSHGFPDYFKIRLTTTGTLPDPLLTATDYFVIVVDTNTIKLASSYANAVAGTAITLTDQGSDGAVNTLTGVALAGASVLFQRSNDQVTWANIAAATSITVDGSNFVTDSHTSFRYLKVTKALTAGAVDLKVLLLSIGPTI